MISIAAQAITFATWMISMECPTVVTLLEVCKGSDEICAATAQRFFEQMPTDKKVKCETNIKILD